MYQRPLVYLQSAATMVTTIDVVVDELCSSTVARMPIIRFDTGLLRIALLENAFPAALPNNRMYFSNKLIRSGP